MASKTTQEELDLVRQYLLECPLVPKTSKAIQAALQGLEQERKRTERDEKLMKRFSNAAATQKTTPVSVPAETGMGSADTPCLENNISEDALMEWQDVAEKNSEDDSSLGKRLAQASISAMAQTSTKVSSPLAAIALALHGALLELEFECIGIPPAPTSGGFAPPVRPLPKSQFVPSGWDNEPIQLQYRKNAVGAVQLVVAMGEKVQVQLVTANTKEPQGSLEFGIGDFVNQESFATALSGHENSILPALHYKSLPELMTKFCNTFDLGRPVFEEKATDIPLHHQATAPPPVEQNIPSFRPLHGNNKPPDSAMPHDPNALYDPHEEPNISQFHPRPVHPVGDFGGDLIPSGMPRLDPYQTVPQPGPGNLMGPNHPMFSGGMEGHGMKPRFDPYGPPGGPTDPNNFPPSIRRPRPPPGGSGVPNPDHQKPPSNLGDHMFS